MSGAEMNESGVDAAIRALLEALRGEGVMPIEDGYLGITGLTQDQQLFLAALQRVTPKVRAPKTEALPVGSGTEAGATEEYAPQGPETQEGTVPLPLATQDPPVAVDESVTAEQYSAMRDTPPVASGPVPQAEDQATQNERHPEDPHLETVEPPEAVATIGGSEVVEPDRQTAPPEVAEGLLPDDRTGPEQDPASQRCVNPDC